MKDITRLQELLYEDNDFKQLLDFTKNRKRSIFDIIAKERDELVFSRTLKYFLDPVEDHNLDDYFLREFLHKFIKKNENEFDSKKLNRLFIDMLDFKDANVYREFSIGVYGRIDIFIELPKNKLACLIENKLFSDEGFEQTRRYEEWVTASNLSNKYANVLMCFLTPEGLLAESSAFYPLSFNDILPIFDNENTKSSLSQDNKYLINNFIDWMKECKAMDNDIKKICMNIYKKYKDEINLIIENSPTVTAFFKEITDWINKNYGKDYCAHSGKDWLTLSPQKWLNEKKLRDSSKYSRVRLEYGYDAETLRLNLTTPTEGSYTDFVKNESYEIFNSEYRNLKISKSWGSTYHQMEEWEDFVPENFINDWTEKTEEYSKIIIAKMDKLRSIFEPKIFDL